MITGKDAHPFQCIYWGLPLQPGLIATRIVDWEPGSDLNTAALFEYGEILSIDAQNEQVTVRQLVSPTNSLLLPFKMQTLHASVVWSLNSLHRIVWKMRIFMPQSPSSLTQAEYIIPTRFLIAPNK